MDSNLDLTFQRCDLTLQEADLALMPLLFGLKHYLEDSEIFSNLSDIRYLNFEVISLNVGAGVSFTLCDLFWPEI